MDYVVPYGNAGPDGEYLDRQTSPAIVQGSIPPAAAIEHPMREIVAAIAAAGLEPDGADLTQLAAAIVALSRGAAATAALSGAVELATEAETDAGIDATRAVTPHSLGVSARSYGLTGWQRLPGGMIVQWGRVESGTGTALRDVDVTFPIVFPAACWVALASSGVDASDLDQADYRSAMATVNVGKPDRSGFEATLNADDTGTNRVLSWIALGR